MAEKDEQKANNDHNKQQHDDVVSLIRGDNLPTDSAAETFVLRASAPLVIWLVVRGGCADAVAEQDEQKCEQ